MKKWGIDVAVLCIFFARPRQFKRSFEQVRKARPRVLLLWQDGPRKDRKDDIDNIKKCREIANNVDWECEVHTKYNEENLGCDPSTFYSHKWAFSLVDKCIILEDDLIPSQSFFHFCKEMLDKYENDERVDRVCGTNFLGHYNIPNDYFFYEYGNSSGWATWRRVTNKWEEDYAFMDDEYAINLMRGVTPNLRAHLKWENQCLVHKKERIPFWEHINGAETLLNGRLVVYPRCNLISNCGLDVNSTHTPDDISLLPKKVRGFFEIENYELSFPLKHPKYVISDSEFRKLCDLKMNGTRLERFFAFFEFLYLRIKKTIFG